MPTVLCFIPATYNTLLHNSASHFIYPSLSPLCYTTVPTILYIRHSHLSATQQCLPFYIPLTPTSLLHNNAYHFIYLSLPPFCYTTVPTISYTRHYYHYAKQQCQPFYIPVTPTSHLQNYACRFIYSQSLPPPSSLHYCRLFFLHPSHFPEGGHFSTSSSCHGELLIISVGLHCSVCDATIVENGGKDSVLRKTCLFQNISMANYNV